MGLLKDKWAQGCLHCLIITILSFAGHRFSLFGCSWCDQWTAFSRRCSIFRYVIILLIIRGTICILVGCAHYGGNGRPLLSCRPEALDSVVSSEEFAIFVVVSVLVYKQL